MYPNPLSPAKIRFALQLRGPHCKDKILKFRNIYSQKRNIGVSVPISTFMCLWANYMFPRPVCLFSWRKYVECRPILRLYKSLTYTWMWKLGLRPRYSRKVIHKWDFRCSAGQAPRCLSLILLLSELPAPILYPSWVCSRNVFRRKFSLTVL